MVSGVSPAAPPGKQCGWRALLPVPAALGRLLVLAAGFLCAACGLIYELELLAIATYLTGDSVTQASVVLSVMVFAMGIGSLLAKRLRWRPTAGFGVIEAALALVGGSSVMALFAAFAWTGASRAVLVAFAFAIGVLIGAEVPLLMALIQRVRKQDAGGAVADLFAADYVGALVGGLVFPFLLLPVLGQLRGALLTGAVNAVAGGATVLWLFRRDLSARARWLLLAVNAVVLGLLLTGVALAGPFERAVRRAVYGADVRVAVRTGVQDVVLTGDTGRPPGGRPAALALYLDGRLRVSSRNEACYHRALVGPAMAGRHRRVLILGGGDGLALREVLRHPGVGSVTVVELDPAVVRLARTDPGLAGLNEYAFRDRRVGVVHADAFDWLRCAARGAGALPGCRAGRGGTGAVSDRAGPSGPSWPPAVRGAPPGGSRMPGGDRAAGDGGLVYAYDVVVSDLPDPGAAAGTRLYSQEFYGLVRRVLASGGRIVVHAGAPSVRPRQLWTVEATLRSVGLRTMPYRVAGRSAAPPGPRDPASGARAVPPPADWGFVLASERGTTARRTSGHVRGEYRPLPASLRAAWRAAERVRVRGVPPSTLMRPRYSD